MADAITGIPEENNYATDSAYGGFREYTARTGSLPPGYGEQIDAPNLYPDVDPFGVRSTARAEAGDSLATSSTVTGLQLADGTWREREELMKTRLGRDLVAAAEDVRKGHRRGFFEGLFSGSPLEYLPFTQMFASVGGSRWMTSPLDPVHNAGMASSFYDKMVHGKAGEVTEDERLAGTLDMYNRKLSEDGSWWYQVGSILKQAPAFFAEFGILGKVGQAVRAKKIAGIVGQATDAAAQKASVHALTRAAKIGFDEYAEKAVELAAVNIKNTTGKTFAQAVRELAASPEARKQMIEKVATSGREMFVEGAANAAANPAKWAPGLAQKVSDIRAARAVESTLSRWSSDHVTTRMWRGLRKSVADSVAEGIMDLGSFGTEASTVITTLEGSAGKAALRGVLDLTVGAAARGSLMYFPKEAVSQMIAAPLGAVNRNKLQLQQAAFLNDDEETFDNAWKTGMFLDLLEYVSENTGRGFGNIGRAIGLKLAPGLMAPARRVAGQNHLVEAAVSRDTAGKISKIEYSGLFDPDRYVEIGGRVNRFLTERFGGKAMREKVINDEMASVTRKLAQANVKVTNPAALQASLEARAFQPGVSDEIRAAIGSDIKGYVKAAVKEANDAGLEELKLHGTRLFMLADWMTRKQLDPIKAAQYFERVGYDGVISEMLEERYSDFMGELFGLNARKNTTLMERLTNGLKAAVYINPDTGKFQPGDLLAEAFAFAVPLVARGAVMHGISRLGGASRYEKDVLDWPSLYGDITRYTTAFQGRKGLFIERTAAQRRRLDAKAAELEKKANEEIAAREHATGEGMPPRVFATDAEVQSWRDEAKRYRTASERAGNLFENFIASLAPRTVDGVVTKGTAVSDDAVISAPIYSDEYLLAPDEVYNLALHPTEAQMRGAFSAYERAVNGAAEAIQTQYRMNTKRADESPEGFRRIGHWVAETALRLTGFATTGDVGFMAANPARWNAADRGLPDDFLVKGEKMYGNLLAEELSAIQNGKLDRHLNGEEVEGSVTTAEYDAAHERALQRLRPFAETMMRELIAAHQTRMFSYDEVEDAAVRDVAADMGMEYDPARKEFYSINDPEAPRISYDAFVSEKGNKELIESTRRRYTETLYDTLTAGMGVDKQLEVPLSDQTSQLKKPVADIINIPRGLQTEQQVIYARTVERLAARLPQLQNVVTSQTVDPNRTIDDQVAGTAVRQSYLDHVRNAILPGGTTSISRAEDVDAAIARIDSADPAIVEGIARDLRLPPAYTAADIRRRNREIAMLALRSATVDDPNVALFSRMVDEAERDDRFGNPVSVIAPARRNSKGKWTAVVRERGSTESRLTAADTLDSLAAILKDRYGYEKVQPKVVYTSTDVFTADTAFDMIRFLGLGNEYRVRMNAAARGNQDYLDPAARTDENGEWAENEDQSAFRRASELRLAMLHEANYKQNDVWLYLPPGTEKTEESRKKASIIKEDAKRAWSRLFERDKDGRAIGYLAVAEDLLAQYGASVKYSLGNRANVFGLVSPAHRSRYSISIRAMHSAGLAQNVYVPISHVNAQDYSSALLEASLATRFSSSRAYLKMFMPQVRTFMDEVRRVCNETAESNRSENPELADKIIAFRDATVEHAEGQVRGMTPQTFATFVSAFNLFRTEVPSEWQRSVLGVHAEALVAVAPQVRKLTAYLGWTGVVDRMLGGAGLELEALTGKDVNINAGIARYYALYNPGYVGGGETRRSLKETVDKAFPDGFQVFADSVVNQQQATVAPRFPQSERPAPKEKPKAAPQVDTPVQAPEPSVDTVAEPPAEDPIAPLRVAQAKVVQDKLTVEEVMSVINGGNAEEAGTPAETDENGRPVQTDEDDDIDTDPDQFMIAPEPVQAPVVATSAGTKEVTAPPTKSGLLPSEVRTIARAFQRMSTAMLGQQGGLADLKALVRNKLVPDMTEDDWKALKDAWRTARDDGKYAADWDFGIDKDEDGVMPDGYEGNNARAVEILKSKAMMEFLALMDLVTPTSGRDFQPLAEDMRSNLSASNYLLDNPDADVLDAIGFLTRIANPRAEEDPNGACGRDAKWRHAMSLFDTEDGQRTISRYVRALLGKEGEPPINARGAVMLTYLSMLPTNVRMQLASLLGSCAPATPVRLSLDRSTGKAVFLLREVPKRSGSMSFGVLSSSFAWLAGKTADEINAVADDLERSFKATLFAEKVSRKKLVDATGNGVLNAYAKVLAPVFGADSTLVTVLVSSNLRSRLFASRNEGDRKEKSEWTRLLEYFAPKADGILPDAASVLVETVRGLAAVTKGRADRKTLVDRALDMFQSDSPNRRNITGATTSLQGKGIWKMLLQVYAESKPTSIMTAEVNPERTSRPSSSVAITMPGIEPALQQFMDRRSDKLGFEGVLRTWFNGYADMPEDVFKRNVASLRRTMQWPGVNIDPKKPRPNSVVSPCQIVAKSVSKTAMASEVIAGCEAAYELEGADDPMMFSAKYGELVNGFVKRNMVYVPVYSGDHSSSIIVQVPLAAEFREAGMTYDQAAELVSKWVGLDLLGADAKRSATTSNEGAGTAMWDYAYDEHGDVLKDAEGKDIRGHAYTGILWNSDPDADNEALIGTTGIFGYGADRQKEMAKDPQSGTIKCHVMATGEDTVYGPVLSLIKSLAVSVDGSHGDFLKEDPKRFMNDFAKEFLDGLDGGAKRNSIIWSDFDSIKLGIANSKTIGVSDGDNESVALMKHVFKQLGKALRGELVGEDGKPVEVRSRITGPELDKIIGTIDWANFGGTGKKGRYMLSQLLDGAEIREVKREGDYGEHRMFALMFRSDSLQAFTVANVSHHAKPEFSRTPRNYMIDALAIQRTLRTWNADDMNGWGDRRIFNNRDGVCDDLRDLVSGWSLTGAIMSRDPRSVSNLLRDDEEYQALLANGEPENGKWAREQRMRVFAANAKKHNLNVPILGTDYALVSNGAWVGKNGKARSHSASQMFNDTLQGPRAIEEADREFLRGHRRAGLCNVNCIDASFRYGLYVNDQKLYETFKDVLLPSLQGLTDFRRTVTILDEVISGIVEYDNGWSYTLGNYDPAEVKTWRKKLADCLIDHHGNAFSLRLHPVTIREKNKDGTPKIDPATGKQSRRPGTEYLWKTVSYLDLFTDAVHDEAGRMTFDRTAVYEKMHDSEGNMRTYLGGTMFGFPRTPSYNGSMVFQTLRAALPVTETYDEAKKAEWKPGRDAMVAPDPYTLKVLGCDHDGDKAKLYMLSPVKGKKGQFIGPRKLLGEADALIREIGALEKGFTTVSAAAQAKLDAHIQKLIAEGVLEYERIPDGKDTEGKPKFREGGLVLTRAAQSHVSNAFVQGLFDASRMLPFKANGGESVVAGLVRNGGDNSGSAFGFVTADGGPKWNDGKGPAPNPEVAWDKVLKRNGVLGEKIFDVANGKILRIPRVAARAQDSAARAGDARAVIVSLASAFHMGYMCGFPVGPFASRRNVSGKDWIDFMYHLDHLSNMTFDDIKEQICLRLGVTPGTVETIIVDMLNAVGDGRLFTTDSEFMNAFAEYAISANDPKSSRYWMARAVDPADYEFRSMATISDEDILAADVSSGGGILEANPQGDGPASTFVKEVKSWFGGIDQEDRGRSRVAGSLISALDFRFRSRRFGKPDGDGLKDPVNGFVYWFLNSCPKTKRVEALDAFAKWVDGTRSIKEMKALANAINPMGVDPAANDASSTAGRLDDDFDADWFLSLAGDPSIANKGIPGSGGRRTYGELPEFGTVPRSELPSVLRMRTATALMYDRGVGEVVAALGKRAHDTYWRNADAANGRYLLTEPAAGSSTPGALVVHALHVVPRATGELQLAANAQSVDVALAAFCDVPYVAKSPLNTANMYDVLDKIGRKLAMMRHPETLGSNVTLDVLYGIETMLDVVARFTKNSYAGTQLGIFNYLNEVPNANQWWYDPKKYGGAAKGLSRILLGMGRTGGQIDELRDLVRRVVVGRELDSDGVLGSLPYSSAAVQDDIRSEKHYWIDPQGHKHWREGMDISLALSTENLKKMKALLVGSRSKVMQANREQAESGTARNLLEVPDKIILPPRVENGVAKDAEVVDANLPGALDELIAVFEMLDKYVAKGFTIEPSALFGQLLPTYAAISSRTEGVPDADSPSLLAMFPETAASWSRLAAKWMSDPRFEPFVMANMAVNWSPRNASLATPREAFGGERLSPAGTKGTKPRRAAEEAAVIAESDLRKLAEEIAELEADARRLQAAGDVGRAKKVEAEAKTARGNYRKAVRGALVRQGNDFEEPSWVEYADPKSKHVLSVFDGARGVLFKNTALVLKGQADTALRVKRTSTAAEPAAAQPVVQPASVTPVAAQPRKPAVEKQTPAPDDAKPKDAYVQKVADRMAGLMKMWDMGRVEYKGGSTFAIYGRFHESQGLTGGAENVFKTRIDVEVLPEGERIADDEKLRRVMNSKNYRQSLAQKTGRTLGQLEDMAKAGTLFDFAKANQPVGVSRSFRPGTTAGFGSTVAPGEWRVDAERVGVLTGRIRLARSDKNENVVYHEFFHSVMGFMRALGSFSQKDIAALQKRYGEDNLLGDKWFNEEKAAEEFRAMVNEGTEPDKSVKGIWTWVKDFLNELWSTLTQGAFSPDDYANDLRRNPLASIVLTGRFAASAERKVSEPKDFLGKIDAAVATSRAVDAGLGLTVPDETREQTVLRTYNQLEGGEVFNTAPDSDDVRFFGEFLNRINAVGYPERSVRNAEIRRIIEEFDARIEHMGTLFKTATVAFMKECGPVSVPAPVATAEGPAEPPVVPTVAVKPASPKEIAKSVTDEDGMIVATEDMSKVRLSSEQTQVVSRAKEFIKNTVRDGKDASGRDFLLIQGEAGTGKTTLVHELVRQLQDDPETSGIEVCVSALSRKAVHVLADKLSDLRGIKAQSLYSLSGVGERTPDERFAVDPNKEKFSQYQLILVDEASMVSGKILDAIAGVKLRSPRICFVFLGDRGQVGPISTSGDMGGKSPVFNGEDARFEVHNLSHVFRQSGGSPILGYAKEFRKVSNGEADTNVSSIAAGARGSSITDGGALVYQPNGGDATWGKIEDAFKHAADTKDVKYAKIIAATNARVSELNRRIHDKLFPGDPGRFAKGELVMMYDTYSRDKGDEIAENSEEGVVTDVLRGLTEYSGRGDVEYSKLYVRFSRPEKDGGDTTVPLDILSPKDRTRWNDHCEDLRKTALEAKNAYGPRDRRTKHAWREFFAASDRFANVKPGYAMTVHKAQGSTYRMVFVDEDNVLTAGAWSNEQRAEVMYTALTRAANIAVVMSGKRGETTDIKSYVELNESIEKARSNPARQAVETTTVEAPTGEVNIWAGSGENSALSNLAHRPFTYGGRLYDSVEHAYQTLKSGKFVQYVYDNFKSLGVSAIKRWTSSHKEARANRATNVSLMNTLVRESFEQNPGAAQVLLATGDAKITHEQATDLWKTEFPKAIEAARGYLRGKTPEPIHEITEAEAAAVPVTLESVAETSPTVPNPKHESTVSDLVSMPEDSVDASDIAGFLDDAVLDGGDTTQFMVAPAVASVRDAMRSVNRMNRPYTRLFSLARQVGLALRDGIENAPEETVSFLSSLKEVSDYAVGKDRAMAAVRKVATLYGVDISDSKKAENLLFRAMNELAGEIGSECWTKGFGKVRLADGTRASSATHVSPAVLAAAISTSVGVRPRDIAEAAIEDLNSFILRRREDGTTVGRYPEDNTFVVNVINPLVSALTRLSTADPTGLVENTSEGLIDDVLKSMHAGTEPKSGGVNSDGTYRDFIVSKIPGASKNPYFETNRLRYMDHENNPDFHKALHRALDAVYMIKAAMKFHKAIGFEPGTVDEMASARQLAPNAPEPLTGAEMASSMYVAPEQLTQDGFQPVYDYDQTWFCANHPLAWFESVSRPGEFGGVDFREMAQGVHRQVAGFHSRINSTNVLMNRRFGLDVLPGQGIHAKIEGQTSDFVMDGGEIRHLGEGKGKKVEKYDAYNGKKAKGPDGKTLSLTVNQQRLIDMLLKARKVRYSGGTKILTGVDGVTFSLNDLHDADYYSWDKVQARARVGRSLGYSPFDTALVRLHRQLADDVKDVSFLDETLRTRDESWDDIIGKDGLDLYDRLRNAAVTALREAKRLTESRDEKGRPMLRPNEVNDFVLGQLEAQGLLATRERLSKELGRHARTEGVVILQVKEIEGLFDRSEAKKILLAAGRTEEELSYDGFAKPLDEIWNEVREFVSSSRFLSDGDGEFFHNMNTPLPFSQGSGFFMYYANRREKGSKLQTDTETMNRWETAFDKLLNSTDLSLPVALADAEQLLLFKELFHTEEKDVESIRSAMVRGDYSRPVEGRRPALSPALTEGATLRDLCKAIYSRMTGMIWKDLGDPTLKESADAVGAKSIGRMVRMYERHRFDDQSLVAGGTGMTDELVYKMTGCLPHNDQLGHAIQRAIDGITNAYAFRATLYNMLTTPDEDGMPICYALPAEDAQDTGGIPDECWGSIADWWAYKNGLSSELDITKSGVWNARHIYGKIHGGARSNRASGTIEIGGKPFAELAKTDIDQRSIEGFLAQATTPENESKTARLSGFRAGGYALGYAKHLLQSTRGLGPTWQRASIHRALSYSKGLSVSFGYFFPLTTRFESPIAASGLIATAGGNFTPEFVREHAESLSKLQSLFRGKGWLTKDFTGQRDIFDMLDSNDPYLSELYHWAGALGLTISDANANPYETSRAVIEDDVRRVTEAVRAVFGNKVSRRTNEILKAVLTSGGERAFTYHMNATKLAVASQLCTRMQIEAAKDGKAFDPVRDLKKYTNYINSEIGGIDPLEYAWAHPAARNLMTNLFFSWEWTRGSWATGYNVILEQLLFGGHGVTREQRKFLPGRVARLFLTVGIGYPMMFQLMSKALGELIIAGIDPDDPELDEKTRQLIRMVHETPWWTWQNEDKTSLTAWDVTPLAAAMGAAFPSLRDSVGNHPFLRTIPAIAAFVTHKPWLLALSFPMYTGGGDGNRKTMARRIYAHSGKQLWEDPRWWTDTKNQFFSKLPMPHQRIAESIMGRSLTWMDQELPWNDENDLLRWINPSMDGALFNLLRACVPFAATSTGNFGDAGFWTLVGPVQMGASTSDVAKRMASYLDRWSSNDRRGYAFGGPVRSGRKQNYGEIMSKSRPEIAHLVREAMANGVTEKDAYKLVSSAVGKLTGQLISDIVDTMPLKPGDDYDVERMGKLLRKAQRLGKLPQQIYDSVKDRLVAQSRWGDVTEEAKRRMANIILASREAPYRTDPVKYDY